eukprot:14956824-Alexandrium_andersonii.AAC.1
MAEKEGPKSFAIGTREARYRVSCPRRGTPLLGAAPPWGPPPSQTPDWRLLRAGGIGRGAPGWWLP